MITPNTCVIEEETEAASSKQQAQVAASAVCMVNVTEFNEYPPLRSNTWSWGREQPRPSTNDAAETLLYQLTRNSSRRSIGMCTIIVQERSSGGSSSNSSSITEEETAATSSSASLPGFGTPPCTDSSSACHCSLDQLCVDLIRMMGKQLGFRAVLLHSPSVALTVAFSDIRRRKTSRSSFSPSWSIGIIHPIGLQHDQYGVLFCPHRRTQLITDQEWKEKYVHGHREYCLDVVSRALEKKLTGDLITTQLLGGRTDRRLVFSKMTASFPATSGSFYCDWLAKRYRPDAAATSANNCSDGACMSRTKRVVSDGHRGLLICTPSPPFFDEKRKDPFFQVQGGICLIAKNSSAIAATTELLSGGKEPAGGTQTKGSSQSSCSSSLRLLLGMGFAFPYDRKTAFQLRNLAPEEAFFLPRGLGKAQKEKILRGYCLAILAGGSVAATGSPHPPVVAEHQPMSPVLIFELLVQKIMVTLRALHARSIVIFLPAAVPQQQQQQIISVLTRVGFEQLLSSSKPPSGSFCFIRMVQSSKHLITESSIVQKDT